MAYAKFTFFEAATQHGYVMSLMADRVQKSRDFHQIIIDPQRGRVFQLFKSRDPETPFFEYVIPERLTTESNFMWRAKVKGELDKAWERMKRARSGGATTEASESQPLSPSASSTDAPQKSEPSNGESGAGEPGPLVLDPGLLTPESYPTDKVSSPASAPVSRKSGSKSRSSSGGSKGSSGSATARAESTPANN